MQIARIETCFIPVSMWADLWDREKNLPLVTPLSMYPEYKALYPSWYWDPAMTVVVLTTDDGTEGIGWCEDGTGAAKLQTIRNFADDVCRTDHQQQVEVEQRVQTLSAP